MASVIDNSNHHFFMARLRNLMESQRITEEKLADRIGVSVRSINGYKNGNRKPQKSTLECLAFALNVSTEYLSGKSDMRKVQVEFGLTEAEETEIRNGVKFYEFLEYLGYEFEIDNGSTQCDSVKNVDVATGSVVDRPIKLFIPETLKISSITTDSNCVVCEKELSELYSEVKNFIRIRLNQISTSEERKGQSNG